VTGARAIGARARLDGFDALVLGALALMSMWILGLALWQVIVHGRIWTGTENVFPADGMQSLMWIQGIREHGASPDLYVLAPTSADFFQPLVAISAGLAALGLAPYLALLLWKPIAVGAVFLAVRAYVRGTVTGRWARRAALVLALFFAWGEVIGDSWIPFWTWGYPFALISLACMVAALLAYARDRAAGRVGPLPALLGALSSWLHPWQGETLIMLLIACELAMLAKRERPRTAQLLLAVAASAAPLVYFAGLVHFDPVWARERQAALSTYPISRVLASMWPLALGAALAYRTRPVSFLALSARLWPFVSIALFLLSEWQGSGPTHALLGVTIPLAVLAVEGVGALPWEAVSGRARVSSRLRMGLAGAVATLLVCALTIPGAVWSMEYAKAHTHPRKGRSDFIAPGENAALSYLAHDPRSGGVLTRFYLGMLVPATTGRRTYVGDCYWSQPNCGYRSEMTERLLRGRLSAAQARAFVRASGARFVLGDCRSRDLTAALAPMLSEVRRFSCARLYVLRG
jgi:hypothetical protein